VIKMNKSDAFISSSMNMHLMDVSMSYNSISQMKCTVYFDVSSTNVFQQVHSVMKILRIKYVPFKNNLLSIFKSVFLENLGIKNLYPEVENIIHMLSI
jgi:hypothetical protein